MIFFVIIYNEVIVFMKAREYIEHHYLPWILFLDRKDTIRHFVEKKEMYLCEMYNHISKEFKADPIGFGKYYRTKVLTLEELDNIKWEEIFPNSEFNIEFQLHLDTTQMVSNQIS